MNSFAKGSVLILTISIISLVALQMAEGNPKKAWDGSLSIEEIKAELLAIVPLGSKSDEIEKLLSKDRPPVSFNIIKNAITMHPQSKKQQLMERAIFAALAEVANSPESPVAEVTGAFFLFKDGKLIEVYVWKSLSGP